jgi:hypothetical protein
MIVTVRPFAILRERAGSDRVWKKEIEGGAERWVEATRP